MRFLQFLNNRLDGCRPAVSLRICFAAVILLVILPIALLPSLRLFMDARAQQTQLDENLARCAAVLSRLLGQELRSSFDVLDAVAQSEPIQQGQWMQLEYMLRRYLRRDWNSVFVLDAKGKPLLDTADPTGSASEPEPLLSKLHQHVVGQAQPIALRLSDRGPLASQMVVLGLPIIRAGVLHHVLGVRIGQETWQRLASFVDMPAGAQTDLIDDEQARAVNSLAGPAPASQVHTAWRAVPMTNWQLRVALPAGSFDAARREAIMVALATGIGSLILGIWSVIAAVRHLSWSSRRTEIRELASLFNSVPVAMAFTADPECREIGCNPAMDILMGRHGSSRQVEQVWLDRGQVLPPHRQPLQRAAGSGEAVTGMELEIAIEGSPSVFVIASAVPLRGSEGRLRGAVSALVDITQHKRIERNLLAINQQLRESQRLIGLAQQAGCVGFFHYRLATDRLVWTPGHCKLFGINTLPASGLSGWLLSIDATDRDRIEREFWTACALRREKATLEYRVAGARGLRWLSSRVLLYHDSEGRTAQAVGITLDISDHKQMERERTLSIERALAARREAETVTRAKDELLATLSHELRNPLGAISTAVDVLGAAKPGSGIAIEASAVVARQTRKLAHLMNDLLDMSRVATRQIMLSRQPVDLAAIVQRVHDGLSTKDHAASPLKLELEQVWINADVARMEQIVTNLLADIIQHAPRQAIHVRLRHERNVAVLVVQDMRMPQAQSPLFDLPAQDKHGQRSGRPSIGLTLVRGLIELHGGTLAAYSSIKGTCLTACLPAVTAPILDKQQSPPSRCRQILVIEDNGEVLAALRSKLELDGYCVSTAVDGIEGLTRLLKLKPEVSIVEIGLPGLTGFELARRARAAGYAGKMIALSGHGASHATHAARVAGFDACLIKPVSHDDLYATLNTN